MSINVAYIPDTLTLLLLLSLFFTVGSVVLTLMIKKVIGLALVFISGLFLVGVVMLKIYGVT